MPSISFPFRVDPATRGVAANPSGSDAEVNEAIALHVLTHTGERPLRPDFGTPSLPFGTGLEAGPLQIQLTEHGWGHITITDVEPGRPEGNWLPTVVSWERRTG